VRFLLDTCTFLWIAEGSSKLSTRARELFLDPENSPFLSVVSVWEISLKYAAGRLPLPEPPEILIPTVRIVNGIIPLALEEEEALHLARLPRHHNDPFDRMLVCQSIYHGLALVSPDPALAQYPARLLW
jgi:PIN domain nuclease of toxin-antitoxin system